MELLELPSGYYAHECLRCGHKWISKNQTVGTCANQKCRSPYWNKKKRVFTKSD